MTNTTQIIGTSIVQAFQELRANKLRTFLSLLGITIGIFCIIAVRTVLDSLKNNIQTEMASLGSDVLYIGRWPWMDEGGDYKWWEYWRRRSMTPTEVKAITSQVPDVAVATLCLTSRNLTLKHNDQEVSSIAGYAVMNDFDKIQNIEIAEGRYLNVSELDGGSNTVVLGDEVSKGLFPGNVSALGKSITFMGRKFEVVGIMKKVGQNMAGFDFDNAVIYPYYMAANLIDVRSLDHDPLLAVKAAGGKNLDEVKYEVEGVLRRVRKVKPGQANDFAINHLSQVSDRIESIFGGIDLAAWLISGLSFLLDLAQLLRAAAGESGASCPAVGACGDVYVLAACTAHAYAHSPDPDHNSRRRTDTFSGMAHDSSHGPFGHCNCDHRSCACRNPYAILVILLPSAAAIACSVFSVSRCSP